MANDFVFADKVAATGFPASPLDLTFDAGAGSDLLVVIWTWTIASFANVLGSALWNGGAATANGAEVAWSGGNDKYRVHAFLGAAGGSHVARSQWTGDPSSVYMQVACWSGVAAINNIVFNSSGGAVAVTASVTTTSGDLAVVQFLIVPPGERVTITTTEVEQTDEDFGVSGMALYQKPAVGSPTSVVGTGDGSTIFSSSYGLSLTPVSGGGGSSPSLVAGTKRRLLQNLLSRF